MGVPFAINNAVTFIRGRLGVIILAFLSGSVVVAMLEVATGLTIRLNVLGRSVNDSLYPFLSSQFVKDVRSLWKYTANGIRFLLIPGFLFATLLWVFGGELVLLLYGEEFVAAIPALKLLALLIPLRFVTYSLGTTLTASNRQGQRSATVTVAAVISVIFNFLLIPRFQLMGAVFAMIITEVILFGQTAWYLRAEMQDIINWRYFIGPVLGSIMILSASYLFNTLNTWILIILSILLYLIVIVALDRSSIKPLRLILSRRQL
jgi:O-antigen/teichoic acid export membrane protein